MPPTPQERSGFKGNKRDLPFKHCKNCDRVMVWRKSWANCWEQVCYCSERCRREVARKKRPSANEVPFE